MKMVSLLMSSFNGGEYIGEQLASIQSQTFQDWKLLIRDDGSTDNTREIIREYAARDSRILLVEDNLGNLRPSKSFMRLCTYVDTPFFMFSDQDDVWLPNKVELALSRLTDTSEPQAIFTDLHVVDGSLDKISESFMRYSRFDPIAGTDLFHAIFQNVVVGCTMGGNRSLLEISGLSAGRFPDAAMMHDWWLALVAVCFGKLTYIDKPTLLYRQHGKNSLGAKTSGFFNYFRLLRNGQPWLRAQIYLKSVISQARNFEDCYGARLSVEQLAVIRRVTSLDKNTIVRLIDNYINGIKMHSFDRNVALWTSFLMGKKPGGFL